jgi:hypothetical protein
VGPVLRVAYLIDDFGEGGLGLGLHVVNCRYDEAAGVTTIQMYSSLTVTTAGLPLGLTALKFWTRNEFKGCNALKRKNNPTRVPIEKKESIRWLENLTQSIVLLNDPKRFIHIGDRKSDIYIFTSFSAPQKRLGRKRQSQTVLTTWWSCLEVWLPPKPSRVAWPARSANGLIGLALAFAR